MKWFGKLLIEVIVCGVVLAVIVYFVLKWIGGMPVGGGGGVG